VTSAVIVLILVAMVYANNFLNARMAENEFITNKQFMLTTALQIDDIAWTIGRTQTIRYTSNYGQVNFQDAVLHYSIEVMLTESSEWQEILGYDTGIILFDIPSSRYTLGNNYFERIFPSSGAIVQSGPTAAVSHVCVIEKLPMEAGNSTRVVIVPTVRMLSSAIDDQNYVRFYLPLLKAGAEPRLSQSVTLIGKSVTQYVYNVTQVRFSATFPQESIGFDSDFFKFEGNIVTLNSGTNPSLAPASVVEFFAGEVAISLGLFV
jgi:hypothetical protein